MNALPRQVRIVEVGPRDGLQNEARFVPTAAKLAFIRGLVDAGLREIEATSFVHPKAVPQLADAADVVAGLPAASGVRYSALVPNERGLDRAIDSGMRRIAVFTAASDTFTSRNIGMTVAESLNAFRAVVDRARSAKLSVRGYVSTAFVCPFEGNIPVARVREVVAELFEIGCDQVAVSDTIGAAAPPDVVRVLEGIGADGPLDRIALHFHDTYGTALANVYAGLECGITTFDASAGGLGGCPYAPGASGNLATEDLVYMLDRMGIATGVDLGKVVAAASGVAKALGRTMASRQSARLRAGCEGGLLGS